MRPPPGPRARALLKRDEAVISPSYARFYQLVVESGRGCIVRDVDGNEFIDFNSGLACLNVGHSHPRVVEAIKRQAEKFLHYSHTDFYYEQAINLAEGLFDKVPGDFEKKFYYGNSGAESVEAAIKLSRWHTRRQKLIAFIGSFHGRTMGAVSLTASKPVQRQYFSPLLPEVEHVPYPYCYRCPFKLEYPDCSLWCVDYIDEYLFHKYVPPDEVAAFIIEPIQGEGGYVVPPPDYFRRLKKLADENGILLAVDEVQSGVGRTGRWFAIEHWGVEPDVLCIAKAIASGLPLGITAARAELMDWVPGSHASTFGGNPVSCAAANAVLDVIEEERLLENAQKQGAYIMERMAELGESSEMVGDVRGKGLMIGVELVRDKETKEPAKKEVGEIIMRCFKQGLAVISCGVSTIRVAPPLIITRELVDSSLEILERTIRDVERGKT